MKDVDAYIASAPRDAQATLRELRALIKATIPGVEETVSWGVPFYRYHGPLGGFAVYKSHVSFGSGGSELDSRDRELLESKGYKTGKKTFQIKFGQEVPAAAIKRILKAEAKRNQVSREA